MRKFILLAAMLALCIMLTSCSAVEALKYSISGDIIDPVDDFSRGGDKDTFVFGGNDYILIGEMSGDFEVDITDEDVLLGQTSNFPFFPNTCYYANKAEKPEYITAGGFDGPGDVVYLREDLYQTSLRYVLQDTDYEFDFSSAFVKTEEVSYKKHIEGKEFYGGRINFYVKDFRRLTISLVICKINEKWYHIEHDEAFALTEEFLNVLMENDFLP